MIGLKCPRVLMLVKLMVCVSALFAINSTFLTKILILAVRKSCHGCHDLIERHIEKTFNDIASFTVMGTDYRC